MIEELENTLKLLRKKKNEYISNINDSNMNSNGILNKIMEIDEKIIKYKKLITEATNEDMIKKFQI